MEENRNNQEPQKGNQLSEQEEIFDASIRQAHRTLREKYKGIPFAGQDWMLLMLSLIPASILCLYSNLDWYWRMGLAQMSMLILGGIAVSRRRAGRSTAFLLICDAMLIGFGVAFRENILTEINLFIIPMLTALGLMSISGISQHDPLAPGAPYEALRRSAYGLFQYFMLPIVRVFGRKKDDSSKLGIVIISLMLCLPVLFLVLLLLSSADEVFSSGVEQIFRAISQPVAGHPILRAAGTLVTALMLFSWVFALKQPGKKLKFAEAPKIPAIFFGMLLTMLNVVYAGFVYIQFSYLFGGMETAAMTGGYAEYARNGFFQLVTVAAINLGALMIAISSSRSGWLRGLAGMLILATSVILFSAVWRMRLYIQVYGLSVLRVMTLWGTLAIGVLLIISAMKVIRPDFHAYSVGFVCLLVLWVGLNAVNIDRIVANYNVNHYLSGELGQIDVEYLETLAPSAQGALERLEK